MTPSVLLLQARHARDPARLEEIDSFARRSGLESDRFTPHDLLEGPPSLAQVRSHDLLMVGGAGDFYVSKEDLPFQASTLDLLREVCTVGHPTFASCFGFQLLVRALGGEIDFDPDSTEVGTYTLELTEAGRNDELFRQLPERFDAQMGRKDRAFSLPPGSVHLASSEACPYQALRIDRSPIWASQFHPELDGSVNRSRYLRYLSGYAEHLREDEQSTVLARFRESPATLDLLQRFVALVT